MLKEGSQELKKNARFGTNLRSIEDGLRGAQGILDFISEKLHSLYATLKDIGIRKPAAVKTTFNFPVLGRKTVVTGISLVWEYPFRDIAYKARDIASKIDDIEEGLETMADALKDLRDALPDLRAFVKDEAKKVEKAGKDMVTSGAAMEAAADSLNP